MSDYAAALDLGRQEYRDVLAELHSHGMTATFTQTGGMNAALEVMLDGGYTVLVTEADDSLAWARAEHQSWGAALFPPGQTYDGECIAADTTKNPSPAALRQLVGDLLVAAIASASR